MDWVTGFSVLEFRPNFGENFLPSVRIWAKIWWKSSSERSVFQTEKAGLLASLRSAAAVLNKRFQKGDCRFSDSWKPKIKSEKWTFYAQKTVWKTTKTRKTVNFSLFFLVLHGYLHMEKFWCTPPLLIIVNSNPCIHVFCYVSVSSVCFCFKKLRFVGVGVRGVGVN